MGPEVGLPARLADGEPPSPTPSGQIVMPIAVNLASERLVSHGLYLLDAGDMLMMWVGRAAPPAMIQDVFDRPSLEALDSGKFALPVTDSPFNRRIHNIIGKIRERIERRNFYPELYLVKEEGGNPMLKLLFLSFMVEDRHDFAPSYAQFLNEIKERVNKTSF